MANAVANNLTCGFSSDSGGRQIWIGNSQRTSTSVAGGGSGSGLWGVGSGLSSYAYLLNNFYGVAANQFSQNTNAGMLWDSTRGELVLALNLLKNNGLFTAAAGIRLASSSGAGIRAMGNALVIGNMSYDDQNVKTQIYGLQVDAFTYHVSAIHNDLRGNKTGAILDNGVATYTHGNLGYNPRGFLVPPAYPGSGVMLYNPFNCDVEVLINGSAAAALTAIAIGGIAAPVNRAFIASGTGGTLIHSTNYYYRISAIDAAGETLASVETSIATPAGADTCSVVVSWIAVPGAFGYKVYGRATGAELLMVGPIQQTAWLDDGSIAPAGALPGADTSGSTVITGLAAAPPAGTILRLPLPFGWGIKITSTTFATANWQWLNIL
jgi:hypothetical protein